MAVSHVFDGQNGFSPFCTQTPYLLLLEIEAEGTALYLGTVSLGRNSTVLAGANPDAMITSLLSMGFLVISL